MIQEFSVIEHVCAKRWPRHEFIRIGPGDDMALLELRAEGQATSGALRGGGPKDGGGGLLAAVDQVVQGVHFRAAVTPLELIGRKAMTRCLSDVAAMAARPLASLAAAVLPPQWTDHDANALFDAMHATAEAFHCPLVGGDVAVHVSPDHPLTVSVTVLAVPGPTPPITRGGARAGDVVYATGVLGGTIDDAGLGHHLTFTPRIEFALQLAERLGDGLHAMIDISDGLGRDAGHIASMSHVQIELEAESIPNRAGIAWREAVSGGEDYELCFCAAEAADVPPAIDGVPITAVGRVRPASQREPAVVFIDGDQRIPGESLGWEHAS